MYYVASRICVQPIYIILMLWQKNSAPLQNWHNWWQPPLSTSRRPSRSNDGAPVPAARPQPSIFPHCPVPIGSTLSIKHTKPAPTSHFWNNTPSAVIQYRLFHQINPPSKLFPNRHYKRCETVPSFLIRLPAPPSHFKNNTQSTVSQSFHYSLDSSLINDSYVIKKFISDSDNASSDAFFASCWEILISKAFFLHYGKKYL